MKTMKEVQDYLKNEQTLAAHPGTPEWQVFTTLLKLAPSCNSVEQFIRQAKTITIDGPNAELKEAQQWLSIALDMIQGS